MRLRCRQDYGHLYSSADFHHRRGEGFSAHGNCQIQDQDFYSCYDCVQQCDLGGLADLATSKQSVQVPNTYTLPACVVGFQRLDSSCAP